ncbi:MAG: hypothetical protein C5B58_02610 [Acidobacteria bacterium]|nr:MAG: hypothetical protein C5B58_02610 [Acidobacteriota bacterium]
MNDVRGEEFMNRISRLRNALAISLLIAILGISGSPILQTDMANAAEEKQLSKTKKQVKDSKPKKNARLKTAKGKKGKKVKDWSCPDWPDCD